MCRNNGGEHQERAASGKLSTKSGTRIPKNASKNPPELRPVSSTSDKRQQESCPAQISFQEQKGIGSCEIDAAGRLVSDEPPNGTRIGRAAKPCIGRSKQEQSYLNKKCLCGADMEKKKIKRGGDEKLAEQNYRKRRRASSCTKRKRQTGHRRRTTGALLSCHG